MNPRDVLILAPVTDPHACALNWALERQGVRSTWVPSLPTGSGSGYAFHIDAASESLTSSMTDDGRGFSAVWNRRLHHPVPVCAESDKTFVGWEWKMFQRNLFALADAYEGALWVNRLTASQHAENKLVQLHACREVGLLFPETVVTNQAEQVDALRKKWGRIIFKSFLMHRWENEQTGKQYGVGVPLLDERSELPADSIAVCPGIYQRYIDKVCDIRVIVIGQRYFAVSLRSATGDAFVDWRPYSQDSSLVAEAITLPTATEDKLRGLMRRLDLVFGCIDLVVDRQGEIYFLEVNQAGQFLFVEDLVPEHPILQAMTALLRSGREDYDLDLLAGVSMAQFRASDAYAAQKEQLAQLPPERSLFSFE